MEHLVFPMNIRPEWLGALLARSRKIVGGEARSHHLLRVVLSEIVTPISGTQTCLSQNDRPEIIISNRPMESRFPASMQSARWRHWQRRE